MINSLFKDSHITHTCRLPKPYNSERSAHKGRENSATVNHRISVNINKPAEQSFCGSFKLKKGGKLSSKLDSILTNEKFKAMLEKAKDNSVLFSAGFALLLTGLLRPAAIMTLPGEKKNKDDKKYAAAHSIASGCIGYVMSLIVTTPIADAIKKLTADPKTYVKNPESYLLKSGKAMESAGLYLQRTPDILLAPVKGIVTIALIPPILKYVFGWEKKASKNEKVSIPIEHDYSTLNFTSVAESKPRAFKGFMGGAN